MMPLRILAVVAVMMTGNAVQAQPQPAQTARARQHAERAERHLEAGEFAEALGEYSAAFALFPSPLLLLNIAAAHEGLGQIVLAIEKLETALESPELPQGRRARVSAELDRLRGRLAELRLDVQPDGAVVFVNGVGRGTSPLREPVRLDPGRCIVKAQKQGYRSVRRELTLQEGEHQSAGFVLAALEGAQEEPAEAAEDVWFGSEGTPRAAADDASVSRVWVYLSGGAAIASLGLATYFGLQYFEDYEGSEADQARADTDTILNGVFIGTTIGLGVSCFILATKARWGEGGSPRTAVGLSDFGTLHF